MILDLENSILPYQPAMGYKTILDLQLETRQSG